MGRKFPSSCQCKIIHTRFLIRDTFIYTYSFNYWIFLFHIYSICNLAVTSTYLRYACSSLLDTKGCVSLQWERVKKIGKFTWDIAYKRWFFSTSLGPIDHWSFSTEQAISEHLKKCPFNVRTQHKDIKTLDEQKLWPVVMQALEKRLLEKRQSAWFIQ